MVASPRSSAWDVADVLTEVAALGEESSKQGVLERLVDLARARTGARFGVALLVGSDGRASHLAHQGMTTGQVAVMPHLPRPVGLVGVVLTGRVLRLEDLRTHPDGVGLPSGHTLMAALLGVPLTHHEEVVGGLYLARPPHQGVFEETDEVLAVALARQAGARISALRHVRQSRELVSVLADPTSRSSTGQPGARAGRPGPSAVVRRLVAAARTTSGLDLAALSSIEGDRQTFTVVETTAAPAATSDTPAAAAAAAAPAPHLLVEGTSISLEEGYCGLVLEGRLPSSVPDVPAHPVLGPMPVTTALGVGAYCGVPVHLPDGSLYGSLCGLGEHATTALSSSQLGGLRAIAELIGAQLAREDREDRDRQARRAAFAPYLGTDRRTVVVQPIVDLRTGTTSGYEALSRFTDGSGAPRRPDLVFAEAHRLEEGIALEQAATTSALALLPRLAPGQYLSVNTSAAGLAHPATFDLLTRALRELTHRPGHAADPSRPRLVVELTEHDQVEDYPALLRVLDGLRRRGLLLAIDDTGAGYASLQHLTRLAPDIVKLDISFVRGIDADPARQAVVHALVTLATDISATLVAEGIENDAELTTLGRLGVTHGQGFHLARPAPPDTHLPTRHIPIHRTSTVDAAAARAAAPSPPQLDGAPLAPPRPRPPAERDHDHPGAR
ncbi:EAL domain-containing protein [uncultured Pseudokineococcus sp.]|uniref:EAL domain-containing protein n=1 Tax=uncultured Pseudokineococcus sp. TaxID=1642928 RepID=UPI002602E236|nr:EAL domain-containing protein [uncultured Pseudokineococcus sp.]